MLAVVGGRTTEGKNAVVKEKPLEKNVELTQEDGGFFEVEITDYDKEVELWNKATIKYKVINTGEEEGSRDIRLGKNLSLAEEKAREDLQAKEEVENPQEYLEMRTEYYLEKGTIKIHNNVTLDPNEEQTKVFTIQAKEVSEVGEDEPSEHKLEVYCGDDYDSMNLTIKDADLGIIDQIRDIPGFTSPLLALAVLTAVAIYRKKKR